jgi:hypothetical protein
MLCNFLLCSSRAKWWVGTECLRKLGNALQYLMIWWPKAAFDIQMTAHDFFPAPPTTDHWPPTRSTCLLLLPTNDDCIAMMNGRGTWCIQESESQLCHSSKPGEGLGVGHPQVCLPCCVAVLLCCCVALFMCALGLACTGQSTMHMICGCLLGSIKYHQKFFAEQWPSNHHQGIVEYGLSEHFITINYELRGWICSGCISSSLVGCQLSSYKGSCALVFGSTSDILIIVMASWWDACSCMFQHIYMHVCVQLTLDHYPASSTVIKDDFDIPCWMVVYMGSWQ